MAEPASPPDKSDGDRAAPGATDRHDATGAPPPQAEPGAPVSEREPSDTERMPTGPERTGTGRVATVAEKTGSHRPASPTGQNRIVSPARERTGSTRPPVERTGATRPPAEKTGASRPPVERSSSQPPPEANNSGPTAALPVPREKTGAPPAPSTVAQRHASDSISMVVERKPFNERERSTTAELSGPAQGSATARLQAAVAAAQNDEDEDNPSRIGRYIVERRLGSGGMADVYLCRQSGMGGFDRQVVIKRIRSHLREREDVIFMFLDEARIVAQVNHPNIVQIYDIDEQDGLPYLVMEYVRGLSLESLSKRLSGRGVKYPIDLVAAIGVQACAGLHAAHELRDAGGAPLNVVHRDVSPSNLLLSVDGVIKIIDFGVARARNRLSTTSAGQTKGRAGYVAPEALTDATLDRRADLFALGVVLYELCTGKTLFDLDTDVARLGAVLTTRIPPLSEVIPGIDPAMSDILSRVLETDPKKRFESAAAFGTALHAVAMRTGRYVTPSQVAEWLEQHLPQDLRLAGRHLTPRPGHLALASESTQPQPSPFSTTVEAPTPSKPPSSVSPVSSMVTSLQLPQFPPGLSSMLTDLGQQVRSVAPIVPTVNEMAQQLNTITPAVADLTNQVRLMRRLYWPLVTLFWLFGLGLILLGVWMVLQASHH